MCHSAKNTASQHKNIEPICLLLFRHQTVSQVTDVAAERRWPCQTVSEIFICLWAFGRS